MNIRKCVCTGRGFPLPLALCLLFLAAGCQSTSAPQPKKLSTAKENFEAGIAALEKNDAEAAIDYFTEAIRIAPEDSQAHYWRGVAYGRKGDYDKAIADCDFAIKYGLGDPAKADAYAARGYAHSGKGNYDKAMDDYSKAIMLQPQYADAYTGLGFALVVKGNYDQAINVYTSAIQFDAKSADAYGGRGTAYLLKDEYDKAIADCTQAIALGAESVEALVDRGDAYRKKGEYAKARADYAAAIEKDARHADAQASLAWLLATCPDATLRDGKKALDHATKSCELAAWNGPRPLGALAAAHAELGKFDEAIRWGKKALEYMQTLPQGRVREDATKRMQHYLRVFEERKPYRDLPGKNDETNEQQGTDAPTKPQPPGAVPPGAAAPAAVPGSAPPPVTQSPVAPAPNSPAPPSKATQEEPKGAVEAPSAPPPSDPVPAVVEHVLEAEQLRIADSSACQPREQSMDSWGAEKWSSGRQLFCSAERGGYVELELRAPRPGQFQIEMHFTKADDYGVVSVSLDGKSIGKRFDGFNADVVPSGKVAFGIVKLTASSHRLRFATVGKNQRSKNYFMGIDCVKLQPVGSGEK